jgi:glycogen debranching enzyme
VPWFTTLFGRDSLITSLQTVSFAPRLLDARPGP